MHKKDCLAQIIIDCQRHGIKVTDHNKLPSYMRSDPLKVGNFAFGADRHSTGISVHVILVHPETDETHEIINGTWWFSERYEFNKFTWNHGKWDDALKDAVAELKRLLADRVAIHAAEEEQELKTKTNLKQVQKKKFEALYTD